MNRTLTALALSGTLLCALMAPPAMALESAALRSDTAQEADTQTVQTLPDSVLYYGQVKGILTGENGSISQIHLESERYGEYVMNLSPETVWIDSGNCTADDPSDLKEGEGIYVFHSPVEAASLPPQSPAYAVVRNVPQDAGCAQYHQVEAVSEADGTLRITTDNGTFSIVADSDTAVTAYSDGSDAAWSQIKEGGYVMAWYERSGEDGGQARASHILVLDRGEEEAAEVLTRADFVSLLHDAQGNPVVNFAMQYPDVKGSDSYGEAVRWATSEGLVSGYSDGRFAPDEAISREQMIQVLWRCAGSPMLMDYTGLTQYEDAGEIAPYARQAAAWAHQQGLLDTDSNTLEPQGTVTKGEAETMIQAVLSAQSE